MARYAAIPEPGASIESLQSTVRALKDVVELLANQRGVGHTPRVFYQIDVPAAAQSEQGDFWFRQDTLALLVYDGGEWVAPT